MNLRRRSSPALVRTAGFALPVAGATFAPSAAAPVRGSGCSGAAPVISFRRTGVTAVDEYPAIAVVALTESVIVRDHNTVAAHIAPGILDRHVRERNRSLEVHGELAAGGVRADLYGRALGAGHSPGTPRGNGESSRVIVIKADAGAGRCISKVVKSDTAGDGLRGGGGKGDSAGVVNKRAAIEREVAANRDGTGTAGDGAARDSEVAEIGRASCRERV